MTCNKVGCCPATPEEKTMSPTAPLPRALTTDDHVRIDVLRERIAALDVRARLEGDLRYEAHCREEATKRQLRAARDELRTLVDA